MTTNSSKEAGALSKLRKAAAVENLPAKIQRPTPKKTVRHGLSFWLHLYVGAVIVYTLTLHGLIASGYIFGSSLLPYLWTASLTVILAGVYIIRRRLLPEGGIIPRRAARTVWLSFLGLSIFWPVTLWIVVLTRELPRFIIDLSVPVIFLFYAMAKILERARVSEPFPILLGLGCISACFTTLQTFGLPNQYYLAASWVGIIIILPRLRQLISWGLK